MCVWPLRLHADANVITKSGLIAIREEKEVILQRVYKTERTKVAAVSLRGPLPSSNNCFMQIWQAERAGSQSEGDFNRGRSKFRGSKFGAKSCSSSSVAPLWRAERRAGRAGAARIPHQRDTIKLETSMRPATLRIPDFKRDCCTFRTGYLLYFLESGKYKLCTLLQDKGPVCW